MKIIEVRDCFIKFEADKDINPSAFVKISSNAEAYIAQVYQVQNSGDTVLALAKIIFTQVNGELLEYDKKLPSLDSVVTDCTEEIIGGILSSSVPIVAGKTGKYNIVTNGDIFKRMMFSVDDSGSLNILLKNLSSQFAHNGKKTIIIDTSGVIKAKKILPAKDIKLSLNTSSLAFLYNECLNDATSDSKALIVEIFKDLSEYSKTVPFVPFGVLKNIIDTMVDKEHVFKLLVLKNKLAKLEKSGYFATTKEEADNIKKVLNFKTSVIDLSGITPEFQNRFISLIYEILNSTNDTQVFFIASNSVSKKSLKEIMTSENVSTAFVFHSAFKYLNEMKSMFSEYILEASLKNAAIFENYSELLKNFSGKNSYLLTGESFNKIQFISKFEPIADFVDIKEEKEVNAVKEDVVTNELNDEELKNEELTEENIQDEDIPNDDAASDILPESTDEDEMTENSEVSADTEDLMNTISAHSEDVINTISEECEANSEVIENLFEDSDDVDNIDNNDTTADKSENDLTEQIAAEEPIEGIVQNSEEVAEEDDLSEKDFNEALTSEEPENTESIAEEDETLNISEDGYLSENETENIIEPDYEEINEESAVSEQNQENEIIEPIDNINIDNENELSLSDEETAEELVNSAPDEELLEENIQNEVTLEGDFADESFEEFGENAENIIPEDKSYETVYYDEEFDDMPKISVDIEENLNEADDSSEIISEEQQEETPVIPVNSDEDDKLLEEFVELDPAEINADDIVVDINDENGDSQVDEDREQEIIQEVNKVYTTRKDEDNDEISDNDLDFIDELNSDENELLEEVPAESNELLEELSDDNENGIIEEVQPVDDDKQVEEPEILEKRDSTTPIVPVYDADIPQEDLVVSDPIQQGDAVVHVKYGNGVVEKMIKYGNKTLFSINFDNIGRRLLDPTLTEIKKA